MSAEKPGRLAVRQVGKIIQMKIVSLEEIESNNGPKFSFFTHLYNLSYNYKLQSKTIGLVWVIKFDNNPDC